jgi:hypothetical protein
MKSIFPFIGGLALLLFTTPRSHGEDGAYVSCPGCNSSAQSFNATAPCSATSYAWLKVDVHKGDGECHRFLAPPYSSGCVEKTPCQQLVVIERGRDYGGIMMKQTVNEQVTTECGETTTKTYTGQCGTSVSFNMVCTGCED